MRGYERAEASQAQEQAARGSAGARPAVVGGEILREREKAAVREYNGEIRRDIEWWWVPST